MIVVGIDPSLTATGIAVTDGVTCRVARIGWEGITKLPLPDRIDAIVGLAHRIHGECTSGLGTSRPAPALAVIEAPDASHGYGGLVERISLYWDVVRRLRADGIPTASLPSALLKAFATGKGSGPATTKKHIVQAVARWWPHYPVGSDDNLADAVVLAEMGRCWLTGTSAVPPEYQVSLRRPSAQWPVPSGFTSGGQR